MLSFSQQHPQNPKLNILGFAVLQLFRNDNNLTLCLSQRFDLIVLVVKHNPSDGYEPEAGLIVYLKTVKIYLKHTRCWFTIITYQQYDIPAVG